MYTIPVLYVIKAGQHNVIFEHFEKLFLRQFLPYFKHMRARRMLKVFSQQGLYNARLLYNFAQLLQQACTCLLQHCRQNYL